MFGALAGLRVLVVVLAFALYSAVVDPDACCGALRRVAPRSALTASLATRMVPLLARDAERMREAYGAARGRGRARTGRRARLRRAANHDAGARRGRAGARHGRGRRARGARVRCACAGPRAPSASGRRGRATTARSRSLRS